MPAHWRGLRFPGHEISADSRPNCQKMTGHTLMPPPRLAFLCLSPHAGGMELDALRMALRFSEIYDTTFICRTSTFIHQRALLTGLKIQTVRGSLWFANKLISIRLALDLKSRLRQHGTSHLIFFGTSEARTIAVSLWGSSVQFFLRHGTTVSRAKKGYWWRTFGYQRVNAYIANSRHIADNIQNFFPVSDFASIHLVYPVITPGQRVHSQNSERLRPKLIYHSRFVSGKGHQDAILACSELRKAGHDFCYQMIGDYSEPKYVESLRDLILSLDLDLYCQILPFEDGISERLGDADIFLGPSYGEGFSNSFIEALSSGLVCLVYKNSSYPECAELGFHFSMAENLDVASLSDKLISIYESLSVEKARSTINVDLVAERFSPGREATVFSALLGQAAAGPRS